jgi:signal transduction histidine kinase
MYHRTPRPHLHLMMRALLILCCQVISAVAHADSPLRLDATVTSLRPGLHLDLLEDSTSGQTLEDVRRAYQEGRFQRSQKDTPAFGFTPSAWWARLSVHHAQTDAPHPWFLELAYPPMQHIDVYLIDEQGQTVHQQGGTALPLSQRPVDHPTHVFPLSLAPDRTYEVYVRVAGQNSLSLPLTLYSSREFTREGSRKLYILGLYVGLICGLIAYNYFLYLTVREKPYLYYVVYLISFLLFAMSQAGLAQQMLFPEWPGMAQPLIPAMLLLALASGLDFSMTFLNEDGIRTRFRDIFSRCSLALYVMSPLSVVLPYRLSMVSTSVIGILVCFVMVGIAIRAVTRGSRPARFYLSAWALFFASILLYALRATGLISANSITQYSMYAGSAAEAVLFSIALAARMRDLREENRATKSHVQKQERMASLGLLSAGVAHEINNPNNFIGISAGNADAKLQEFRRFVDDLLEADTDSEIREGFQQRFHALEGQLALIREGSQRITGIVRSMRSASRDDSQGQKTRFDPVDGLRTTLELVRPSWKHVAHFESAGLVSGPLVEGYPSRLNQVFTNLLVNACHAIEEKQSLAGSRDTGTIVLSSRHDDGHLRITVRDNGCGMTEEVKKRLFEPFFTTKGTDRGTGLGMSLCRTILEEHGGTMQVESTPGAGSTMTLILPVSA